jgi:hypothetical protein
MRKWIVWGILLAGCVGLAAVVLAWPRREPPPEVIDVHPGEDIQEALEEAARRPNKAVVRVHAGVYRPSAPHEALVWFNARHDGIVLEAAGDVTLTAANPDLASPRAEGYPALVSHVVYFGDGISARTVLRGFRITGASGFVKAPPNFKPLKTPEDLLASTQLRFYQSAIEANQEMAKTHYFYTDGGGILVYGRSYPTIENVEVSGNRSSVCGGGVSVQHVPDAFGGAVRFQDCIFRDNHAGTSGSAVDLLTPGSQAILENCLFVGNVSDERIVVPDNPRYGALTIFPRCQATVRHCTFTDNWSGADDRGESTYENCLFWKNTRPGGKNPAAAFELNIAQGQGVNGCFFSGPAGALQGTVSPSSNRFDAPDPDFDRAFRPRNPLYRGVGYRPR